LTHCGYQALAPRLVEQGKKVFRHLVGKRLVSLEFLAALLRQNHGPRPAVAFRLAEFDQPLPLQRAQEAAEIARVEAEPGSQQGHIAATRHADLKQQPRLAERASA